jgi:hypothetical protein
MNAFQPYEAMMLLAMARFTLDLANCFQRPVSWQIAHKRHLLSEAQRLVDAAKKQ